MNLARSDSYGLAKEAGELPAVINSVVPEGNQRSSIYFAKREMSQNELGRYFGYPECCIDYFNTRGKLIKNKQTPSTRIALSKEFITVGSSPTTDVAGSLQTCNDITSSVSCNKGFIPCINCATQIVDGKIKLEDLITNRECETAFPNDDGIRVIYRRLRLRLKIILMKKIQIINDDICPNLLLKACANNLKYDNDLNVREKRQLRSQMIKHKARL